MMTTDTKSKRILAIDDDPRVLEFLSRLLRADGLSPIQSESSWERALDQVQTEPWDLVLLDMKLPDLEHGLKILETLGESQPHIPCVVFTGVQEVEVAVRAMQLGARDYVTKPSSPDRLLRVIRETLAEGTATASNPALRGLSQPEAFKDIITVSKAMGGVLRYLERVAPTGLCLVLSGPTGVGKHLLATTAHSLSRQAERPFHHVHVSGLSAEELASELRAKRASLPGTLFLDEVGDLSDSQQKLLLSRLESDSPICRLIVATAKDLELEVAQGRFRRDLFHRLSATRVSVPSLAHRPEDIAPLAAHFVGAFGWEYGRRVREVSSEALEALVACPWPGNVRELRNVIREGVLAEATFTLRRGSLPKAYRRPKPSSQQRTSLADLERDHCLAILQASAGNVSEAARILAISRTTLHRKLKSWGLR